MLVTVWEGRWLPDLNGGVAQLGEHLPCKQGVMSSNLTISTKQRAREPKCFGDRLKACFQRRSIKHFDSHGDCRDEAETKFLRVRVSSQ